MTDRAATISRITELICQHDLDHPTRVAVDGVTASGKSTVARELTLSMAAKRRPVVHLTMDGYHHRREHRYRQGRTSAQGYYDDAYDFEAFANQVLRPLGSRHGAWYRPRIINLQTDKPIAEPPVLATADTVVIVDGSFLQRPELDEHWDYRIFVNTTFARARSRGIARDAATLGGRSQAAVMYDRRYHAAAHLYIASTSPAERADLVLDNDDLSAPVLHVAEGR